jgi:MFS transporter, FHS family, glucose/mannose:H+ symporter
LSQGKFIIRQQALPRMMTRIAAVRETSPSATVSGFVLSIGFGLTGAGTVMLGVLLPTLSQAWRLHDDVAGFLFFLQFSGSALGAVFTSAHRVHSLMRGYSLLVLSACALAFAGPGMAFPLFFCWGLGLGMTMTATSLLFSDRWSDDRAAKLEALNFAWAAGAATAPMLFLPFLITAQIRLLFFTFLALFLVLFAWVFFRERQIVPLARGDGLQSRAAPSPARLLPLLILAMSSVGVEASLSGWLTTYSHRAAPHGIARAALATSLFWLGVVLSRLAFSTPLMAKLGRYSALKSTMWGLAAAVALLILTRDPTLILVASWLSGLCLGPIYPLLLSFLLERSTRGWIFAVAGTGSAIVPWLTGLLSARFGSLRFGLLAPCAAVLLMLLLRSLAVRQAPPSSPPAPSCL